MTFYWDNKHCIPLDLVMVVGWKRHSFDQDGRKEMDRRRLFLLSLVVSLPPLEAKRQCLVVLDDHSGLEIFFLREIGWL